MNHLQFRCCLWDEATALTHFWEHTVGSGHAPLALRGDWQQQLRESRTLRGFRHTRFHGLLCDEMGTLMNEKNELLYSFFNADEICDFLLSIGMKLNMPSRIQLCLKKMYRDVLATQRRLLPSVNSLYYEDDRVILDAQKHTSRSWSLTVSGRERKAVIPPDQRPMKAQQLMLQKH